MKKILVMVLCVVLALSVFGMTSCTAQPAAEEPASAEAPAAEAPASEEPAAEEPAAEEPAAEEPAAEEVAANTEIPEGLKISYYVSTLDNAYHQGDANWAKKYAEEQYGAEVTIMDGKSDTNVMAENVEATYAGGYDMASVFVWNGETVQDTVQEMVDSGMVCNTFYQDVGNVKIPFIYCVESEAAYQMGVTAATKWKEWYPDTPIKYAVIGWMENPTVEKERTSPFIEGIKSIDPNAEEVAMLDAGAGTDAAYKAAQDLIQSNPDVNIVYGESNDLTIGILSAFREAGRGKAEDGKCLTEILVSTDAPASEIQDIYDPTCSLKITMSMTPMDNAIARIDNLMDIYLGKIPQVSDEQLIINTKDVEIDYWNVTAEEAIEIYNNQYMGSLTLADLEG